MVTNYYTKSTQRKKVFPVSILGTKKKIGAIFRNSIKFDHRLPLEDDVAGQKHFFADMASHVSIIFLLCHVSF